MPAASRLAGVRARLYGTPFHTAWLYGRFALGAFQMREELAGVRTYCLFLGHARSGHSIVGALLDAHPQIAISDELDAVRYATAGFSRGQLLYGSFRVARRQAANTRRKAGLGGTTYSYHVPGQWQGRAHGLRVVGDSQAGWTTRRLAADRALLPRLERRMQPLDLRFIHVVRNPYDNIATMMLRGGRSFESAYGQYAANCDAIEPLERSIGPDRIHRLRHEELVGEPRSVLRALCEFLGVTASDDYLDACAGILYRSPSRSRERVSWADPERNRVRALIERHDFLAGYRFDD